MSKKKSRIPGLRAITEPYPPFLVISVAKRNMTLPEMAAKSGIPERTIWRLSQMTSNATVKHGHLLALWEACRFNPFCPSSDIHLRYLKSTVGKGNPMPHLSDREWKRFCTLAAKANSKS